MHYTQTGALEPFIVYRITDHVNDKHYIGLTTTTVENRWHDHRGSVRSGQKPLNIAMREFGVENFTIEVIASCRTLSDLRTTEIMIIRQDNTTVPNGYNVSRGGGFKPKGCTFSSETIEVIRQKAIAYANTPEGRAAKRTFLGKHHSEEVIKRLVERNKTRPRSEEERRNMSAAQRRRFAKLPEEANHGHPLPKIDAERTESLFKRLLNGESLAELARSTGFSRFCLNGAFRRLHGDWRSMISWSPTRTANSAWRTKRNRSGLK